VSSPVAIDKTRALPATLGLLQNYPKHFFANHALLLDIADMGGRRGTNIWRAPFKAWIARTRPGRASEKEGGTAAQQPAWHSLPLGEVLALVGSAGQGLSGGEVDRRLQEHGPNLLCRTPRWNTLRLAVRQFRNPFTGILLLAASFAFVLRDLADGWVILAIVLLNATFGFLLEYRASNALRGLAALHPPKASVFRDGKRCIVPACDIVPGDVLLLEAGDAVSADARLLECFGLACAEAVLTGEAAPVEKEALRIVPVETPLAEWATMVFAGTTVAAGRARALVVAAGMKTEVGKIAHLMESVSGEPSPGLREVGELSRVLLWGAGFLVPLVLGAGWLRGHGDFSESLWTGVSLAVAALPEGLQTVLMVALAIGAHRLAIHKAVVRRLGALETLGCVDVVCADKTGTLTEGRMSVAAVFTSVGDVFGILPDGSAAPGVGQPALHGGAPLLPTAENRSPSELSDSARRQISEALAGACTGETVLREEEEHAAWSIDPTESALLSAARNVLPEAVRGQPLVLGWIQREIPFDSSRRRRTNLRRRAGGSACVYVTGAPEEVFALCSFEWFPEGVRPLDAVRRRWWAEANTRLAGASLRVLASAYRPFDGDVGGEVKELESELVLVGLVGLRDALRPDAATALQQAAALGVKVVMLTGDQPQTAAAIARELGFDGAAGEVVTGVELSGWSREKMADRVADIRLYARVTPGDKLRIVEAWRAGGAVVAMVGDGVNDAPALQAADVGVAMGKGGAHVTREAGDLVLLDDRLGTLMEAIAQGRRVRRSVGRAIEYLLTGNAGEVLLIGGGMLAAGVSVLSPLQLLWINLVTDGLPALLLALPDVAAPAGAGGREPPVARFTSSRLWTRVIVFGCCAAVFAGLAYRRGYSIGGVSTGKAYAFGAVVFEELLRSVVIGAEARIRAVGVGGAGRLGGLVVTMAMGCLVQVLLMRVDWAAQLLGATALSPGQIAEAFSLGGVAVCVGRLVLFLRLRNGGAEH
jgi:Ca2+-transporting ATPase